MEKEEKNLIFAQVMNCMVETYNYSVVRFREHQSDVWLTNKSNEKFPIIRLNSALSSSIVFEKEYLEKAKSFLEVIVGKDVPVLILNIDSNSKEFMDDGFEQRLLTYEGNNESIFKVFPDLQEALKNTEDKEKEIKRLNDNLLKIQEEKLAQQEKNARKVPKFTLIIGIICVAIYVLSLLITLKVGDESVGYIISGASYKMMIVSLHEYWRFLTAGFVHLGIMHLLMNIIALYSLGSLVEKIYNKKAYLAILLSSIIFGNVFVFILDGNVLSAGISGGLYGLMAASIVYTVENQTIKIPMIRQAVFRVVMINLIISLMPGISLSAHLGGFIGGVFLSFILIKSSRWKEYKPHMVASLALIIIGLSYFGYQIAQQPVKPVFVETDAKIVKGYQLLGLDGYAQYVEDGFTKYYNNYHFEK